MGFESRNEPNSACLNTTINFVDSIVAKKQQTTSRFQSPGESSMLKNTMFFATCASLVAISFVTTQTQIESLAQSHWLAPASGSSSNESQITPPFKTTEQSLSPTYTNAAYQLSAIGSGSTSQPSHNATAQAAIADVKVSPEAVLVAPPASAPTVTYPPIISHQPAIHHPPAITYPSAAIYTPAVVHHPAAIHPPVTWPTQPNCFSGG